MMKLFISLFMLLPFGAFAQLSLSPMATAANYGSIKQMFGFGLKLGLDLGAHSQVSLMGDWESNYDWGHINSAIEELQWRVPVKIKTNNQQYTEYNASYTYFFEGDNVTFNSLYASVGPTMLDRSEDLPSAYDPSALVTHTNKEILLDFKLGAAAHIGLGWLFLEGRVAPKMFTVKENGGLNSIGSTLWGVNTGIRFLINRHPRCAN